MGSAIDPSSGIEFDSDGFVEVPITDLNSAIMPVLVMGPELLVCVGTAFNIVGDGILVTARHVVLEALSVCDKNPGSHICALWVASGEGHEDVPDLLGGPVHVFEIVVNDETDLALLQIRITQNGEVVPIPALKLSTRIPKVGSRVLGFGYTKYQVQKDEATPELREIAVEHAFHASGGAVTQVWPGGRDSVMLPTACFETSARFDHGMSGGPVFGEDGRVCGVVSSGVDENEDSEGYISFASAALMVYVLGINENGEHVRIAELVERGLIEPDDFFESFRVVDRDDGRADIGFWYQGS